MKRTFAILLLLLTSAAGADEAVSGAGATPALTKPPSLGEEGAALDMPQEPDRFDWQWLGEFEYGEAGELLIVGSGLSYATSPTFSVGGSYAMAMPYSQSTLRPRQIDPARYTVFMRWRF